MEPKPRRSVLPARLGLALLLALPLELAAGCGEGGPPAPGTPGREGVDNSGSAPDRTGLRSAIVENFAPLGAAPADSAHAAWLAAAAALERGDLPEADVLLRELDPDATPAHLLRARLLLQRGEVVAALRELESARARSPRDGEVYATGCELYCELGRLPAAEDEVRRGLAQCGPDPALDRARGVLLLQKSGGASRARELFERALAARPDLPFARRALSQAHLLEGRAFLREEHALDAVRSARAGLALAPDDRDLRQLHGDALAAAGALRSAVDVFEGLLASGEPVEQDLAQVAWRAGMGELVQGRRDDAVRLWARARELGMTDEALGTAARILREEAAARVEAAARRLQEGALEEARGELAEALWLDPDHVLAESLLAHAHYRLGALQLAAEGWERALALADDLGEEPPPEASLLAARAWLLLDRPDDGRRVLEARGELDPGEARATAADLWLALERRAPGARAAAADR